MAISIPSGFIEICDYSIGKIEDRSSKSGKALKAVFKLGPSPSIKTNGSIEVSTEAPGQEQEDGQTKTQQNNSNSQQSSNSSSQGDNSNNSNNNSDSNNARESYSYSILEAYLRSHMKFEDDNDSSSSNQKSNPAKAAASNNSSNTADQLDTQLSNDTTDQPNTQSPDNTSDQQGQENNEEPKFEAGSNLYVKVLLKNEGCTIWHLILENRVNVDKVANAVKSGSFKSAYEIAHKGLDVDGLIVMSAKTYINSKAPLGCPFLGRCNYAFDSASDKDDDDTTNAVCLAVAPFDGRTNKPSQETVYKVTYSIEEDISNGEIDKLKSGKPVNDDTDSSGSDENQDAISKWIGRKFKNVGDKTMYGNFLKIREFINKQVIDKKLEVDSDETETPVSYSKVSAVKKSLIVY